MMLCLFRRTNLALLIDAWRLVTFCVMARTYAVREGGGRVSLY